MSARAFLRRAAPAAAWGGASCAARGPRGWPLPPAPPARTDGHIPLGVGARWGGGRCGTGGAPWTPAAGAGGQRPVVCGAGKEGEVQRQQPPLKEAPRWPPERIEELVLVAMLAAVSGLAYFLSSLMRLESYLGTFFPLPVVIAAAKCGPTAARRTMVATCLLLSVLAGPLRATTYFLMHGFLGTTVGCMWAAGGRWRQWRVSVPAGTAVRSLGVLGSLALSSWMLRENLFIMVTNQIVTMLDQLAVACGAAAGPPFWFVCLLVSVLVRPPQHDTVVVNGLCYVFLLHILYSMLLRAMGLPICEPPARIRRALFPPG